MNGNILKKALISACVLVLWSSVGQAGFRADSPSANKEVQSPFLQRSPHKQHQAVKRSAAQKAEKPLNYKDGELIVKFREKTSEASKRNFHQKHGSVRIKEFPALRLHHVKLRQGLTVGEAIKNYQSDPDVEYAEPNYLYTVQATPNDPRFGELWGLRNTGQNGGTANADINAPGAWDVTTGSSNVVVAVIDTGVDYTHQDLAANMWHNPWETAGNSTDDDHNGFVDDSYGIDVVSSDGNPMDDHGHGTHVAGTIGAAGNNGIGVVGVNWNVKIMACKFLDAGGTGDSAGAVTCLEYIKAMKDKGVNIVATSNSWGGGGYSQALYDAIKAMPDVLFIVAAGNSAADNDRAANYPANYNLPNVIAVAASDNNDRLASFSDYGRKTVHVAAPGVDILSTLPTPNHWDISGGYGTLSGTSMAAPHVSGLAALLKAQTPSRDWKSIKNLIMAGGDPVAAFDGKTITGRRINASGSVNCSNRTFFSVLNLPATITPGTPTTVSVMSINCANPAGPITVTATGGETITLADDGLGKDVTAGDGIFTGEWIPTLDAEKLTISSPAGTAAVVVPQLRIYQHLAEANVRAPYLYQLAGSGGIKPVTWEHVSGELPPGLTIQTPEGTISGIATTTGTYPITVRITDSLDNTQTTTLSLHVADDNILESRVQLRDSGDFDMELAIAYDTSGNYYLGGSSFTEATTSYDARISKYDPTGALVWSRTYATPLDDMPQKIQVDGNGNVYVGGFSDNWDLYLSEWFVIKYDSAGTLQWSKIYKKDYDNYLSGIAVDTAGNVIATGVAGWDEQIATVKYDPSGNLLWEKIDERGATYTSGLEFTYGAAVGSNGNIFVGGGIGYATTEPDPINPGWYCNASKQLMLKYDPAGNEVWGSTQGDIEYGACTAWLPAGIRGGLAIDGSDNLYVTGTPSSVESDGCTTAKYDAAGNLLWQRSYPGYVTCRDIAVDSAGNSYIAASKDVLDGTSTSYHWDYNLTILKYDQNGTLLWEKSLDAGHESMFNNPGGAYGIALDRNGDIHIAGYIHNGEDTDAIAILLKDIANQLHIATKGLSRGTTGTPYQETLKATGGVKPYTWSISSGTLPDGIGLAPGTGILSGVPTAAMAATITVQVTDFIGAVTTQELTLTIHPVVTGFQPANGSVVMTNTTVAATFSDPLATSTINSATFSLTTSGAAKAVSAGGSFTAALANDGSVYSWGFYGQSTVPAGLTGVTAISAGYLHTVALKSDGTVTAWGSNDYGQTTVPAGIGMVTAIAAGTYHTVAVKADGTVVAWGKNDLGQCDVPAGLTGVTAVAAGLNHTIAVKADGTVVGWGNNAYGQIGIPIGLTGVTAVDAGVAHSVALKSDGTVVAWGYNGDGRCTVPTGLSGVTAISAGSYHTLAVKADGSVAAWGDNGYGQSTVPAGLTGVIGISGGGSHSIALKNDGSVVGWGLSSNGQITTPAGLSSGATTVSGTFAYNSSTRTVTLTPSALLQPNSIYSARINGITSETGVPLAAPVQWSFRTFATLVVSTTALADGTTGVAYSQTLTATGGKPSYSWSVASGTLPAGLSLGALTGIISGTPSAAGTSTITLRATDANGTFADKVLTITVHPTVISYQPANNAVVPITAVIQAIFSDPMNAATFTTSTFTLSGGIPVRSIATGDNHNLALRTDGSVISWGNNWYGQGTIPAGLSGITALDGGAYHSIALKNDGTVAAWGYNSSGQATVPTGLSGVTAIAAGSYHNLALKSNGTVTAWGMPNEGQTTIPPGLANVTAIDAGCYFGVALKSDGTVASIPSTNYIPPAGLTGVTAIAAGCYHALALKNDGTVVAWGSNDSGQTTVPGSLSGVVAVAAGTYHSVALKNDGTVVAWGRNSEGQSSVPSGLSGVTAIKAGFYHTLALKNDNTVSAWGSNTYGQTTLPSELTYLSASRSYDSATRKATLTSTVPLLPGATYYAKVSGAASQTGVALAAPVTWKFTTYDLGITTASVPDGRTGTAYSLTFAASGGTASYTWGVTSGTLPSGLTLSPAGLLSGTPTATGYFTFTVQVTDSGGYSAPKAFTLTIRPTLNVAVTPAGSGTVSGTGISCPGTCSANYSPNSYVTLTATPLSEFAFSAWSGCTSSSGATCSLTMNTDKTVTATFTACSSAISPTLASYGAVGGSGTVTVTNNGGCGWSIAGKPSWVTITSATSGSGNATVAYTVSANTDTAPRTVTMTIGGQLFTISQAGTALSPVLTTTVTPAGAGLITGNGIRCEGTCSSYTATDATIILKALAKSGYQFSAWSGCDNPADQSCTMTMTTDKNVAAQFDTCGNPPVMIESATYTSFMEAYQAAGDADIRLQAVVLNGTMLFDLEKTVTLKGGYSCGYENNGNSTPLNGALRVLNGTVKVENLTILTQ